MPGGVDRGGRERVIPCLLALIERLARKHRVVVFTLHQEEQPSEYALLGAQVINPGEVHGKRRSLRWLIQLQKLIRALRSAGEFDVLHAFWVHSPGTLAVAAGIFLGVPVVVSIGGCELVSLPDLGYRIQQPLVRQVAVETVLHMARAVSAGSAYALHPLSEIRRDAVWLPLGADARLFCPSIQRSPDPPWRLLQVADLNEVKDQTTLLHAIRLVCDSGCQVQLDCFGVDTLEGRIQDLCRQLALGDAVRFHGRVTLDQIVPFYSQAHLFIQSSRHESMGAAVLEAAASGLPTVGTNVGIAAEMAPPAAVTVPVADPHALANAIVRTLNNPAQRESLARAAQNFSRQYDADWTCARLEALYFRVARDHER